MNFLAHFHLAWPGEGLLAGALEGDFHKGPIGPHFAPDLAQGIRLHRAIDAFTDSHPQIVALRKQFPASLRRYAGILIDLSFDHYLSLYWDRYSELELRAFTAGVHLALENRSMQLSSGSLKMLQALRKHDLLNRYHDWGLVTASAQRVGERFKRGNPLLDVERGLNPIKEDLEQAFSAFYPDLMALRPDPQLAIALSTKSP